MSRKNRKQKKARNLVVLGMLLSTKGGFMHDRRTERGGAKNKQEKYRNEEY